LEMKIFFIGDSLLVNGYRTSGIESIPVSSPEELLKEVDKVFKMEDVGVVLVDQDYSSQVKDRIEYLKMKRVMPVLVEVPGRRVTSEIELKSMISRIMGVKV
jgi:V/A-type H+-transporting ATPase subunit F